MTAVEYNSKQKRVHSKFLLSHNDVRAALIQKVLKQKLESTVVDSNFIIVIFIAMLRNILLIVPMRDGVPSLRR